jgi:hypothetical protein
MLRKAFLMVSGILLSVNIVSATCISCGCNQGYKDCKVMATISPTSGNTLSSCKQDKKNCHGPLLPIRIGN